MIYLTCFIKQRQFNEFRRIGLVSGVLAQVEEVADTATTEIGPAAEGKTNNFGSNSELVSL